MDPDLPVAADKETWPQVLHSVQAERSCVTMGHANLPEACIEEGLVVFPEELIRPKGS